MLAHTIYRRGLCPQCGYPKSVCRNQERFDAQQQICHAMAAVERAQRDARGPKGDKTPEPGLLHAPVYVEPVEL